MSPGTDLRYGVNKFLVKRNARTSAELALDFSYLLFEEVHCLIEVVQFDIPTPSGHKLSISKAKC